MFVDHQGHQGQWDNQDEMAKMVKRVIQETLDEWASADTQANLVLLAYLARMVLT